MFGTLVLGPFPERKGPRLPGRNPALIKPSHHPRHCSSGIHLFFLWLSRPRTTEKSGTFSKDDKGVMVLAGICEGKDAVPDSN
jgi:hypothetical protein